MSRIYRNSEAWLFGNQIMQNKKENEARDKRFVDSFDRLHMVGSIRYNLPQDVLSSKYKWNGEMGKLNYYTDTSKRSDFEILNEYNEPYEEGRNTLLWDTCNKYRKNVSSYLVDNSSVNRVYSAKSKGVLIK